MARLAAGGVPVRGRIRLGTLLALRWLAVAGQTAAIVIVDLGLGYGLPLLPCAAAIGASVLLNVWLGVTMPAAKRLGDLEATLNLAYDQLQLAVLLYYTGGIENPFSLLLLAPMALSASALNLRLTLGLGALSFVLVTGLAVVHEPLPWAAGEAFRLPPLYVGGLWLALVFGIGFTAIVTFRVAAEATRMSAALSATQLALLQEQKLSAVGGLAAAAAHQLGTPLGTIAVVAKELARAMPADSPHGEDLRLLMAQVERCRDILKGLSQSDAEGEAFSGRLPLSALLEELALPHRDLGARVIVQATGEGPLAVWRAPELVHGLTNLIDNAVDFAESTVTLAASWDAGTVRIAISDDGPGFAPEIIHRLGEPYVTTRPGREALSEEDLGPTEPGEGHAGMGLGFFIAKTLLERTGAALRFGNRAEGGALVTLTWARADLDAGLPQP